MSNRLYRDYLVETLAHATILQLRQKIANQTQLIQEKRRELDTAMKLQSIANKVSIADLEVMMREMKVHGRVYTIPDAIADEISAVQDRPLPLVQQPILDDHQAKRRSPQVAEIMRRSELAMYDNETTLDIDHLKRLWRLAQESEDDEEIQAPTCTCEDSLEAQEPAQNQACNNEANIDVDTNEDVDMEMSADGGREPEVNNFA